MRVTNSMMMNNFMRNLNFNMATMSTYQDQLSSGRRIQKLSDDPIGIMSSLDAKSKLRKLDMYNGSISDAKSWLTQTETSLREMNDVISQIYENTLAAANDTMAPEDKQATAQLVQQLRQHIAQLGNSTYGGRYIFGGFNTTTDPFVYDAAGTLFYNGVDLATAPAAQTNALLAQQIQYGTGVNISTIVSLNGVQLMGVGANNTDKMLADLVDTLNSGAPSSAFQPFVQALQGKQQDLLSLLADVGGRVNRLDMMSTINGDNEINYTEQLSEVQDIDQAEVTMQFKMAEAVYRSALAVGAKVIEPTLLDFLR